MRHVLHQFTVTIPSQTIFVGRELERSQLSRLLDGTIHGEGTLVVVGGEPGIGKTRLTQEIELEAGRRKIRALRGYCVDEEAPLPYLPFVEILEAVCTETPREKFRESLGEDAGEVARLLPKLRRMFDDIPPPLELPSEQQQRYLFNAISDLITRIARARSLMLVVENLHWADKPTLSLVEHLARRLAEIPVLMLATYRDLEVDRSGPLAHALEGLIRRRQAHSMVLKRLDATGVEAMLRALSAQEPPPALVRTIVGETEGNPLFVEEVFNHFATEGMLFDSDGRFRPDLVIGALEVPHGVRLTIGLVVGRLSPTASSLLTTAAIVGRKFSFNLIRAVAALSPENLVEVLDELLRARLIEPSQPDHEAGFVFSHELIRQTVLSNLSLPRRQELHLRIAQAIESLPPDRTDDYTPALAHHFYEAGPMADPIRASPYLVAAGDRSLEACAFEEALRYFQRALSLNSATEHVTAEVEYKQGLAQRSLGRWEDAFRSWEMALARFEANGEFESAGKICAILNSQLSWSGRWADSIKMGARGLALLAERVTPDRCRMLAANGATLSLAGHHDEGIAMIGQAGAVAAELHNSRLKGLALYAELLHHFGYMRPRSILEISLNAMEQLSPQEDAWLISDLQSFRISSHLALANFDELAKAYAELKPLALRLGNLVALISANRDQMSRQLICSGEIARWREFILSDLAECERIHNRAISAGSLSCLGIVEMWRGNWDEALIHFKEGAEREPAGPIGGNWILVAMAKVYAGDSVEALAMIQRRHNELARPDQPNSLAAWMTMLAAVEVYFIAGQRQRAGQLYTMVLQAIETGTMFRVYDFRLLETVAAIAATAAGNWDAAEVHFAKALQISAEIPHRIEQPDVRRFYAQMLIERDGPCDRDKAHQLLAEAVDIYRQIGMPKHCQMAEDLLRSVTAIVTGRAAAVGVPTASIFRRDGHYWTLAYSGKVVRLKDAKGLRDIACLLAIPGRSVHVADLVAACEGELRDSRGERYAAMSREALRQMGLEISNGGNEPLIDAQARKEYRTRLAELHQELEESERIGDIVRSDSAREELDAVAGQLNAAYGLGHRRREPSDPAEKARIAVAMRIRNALERIKIELPALGRHLSRSIQTGAFCCYAPEVPTTWEL